VESMSVSARSRIMRAIKPKNTTPELVVRKALHASGLRFRLHVSELPGKPDLVLPKYNSIVEVRGCFWHCHACIGERRPRTNSAYWLSKLERNVARDESNLRSLRRLGYRVKIVWECELHPDRAAATLERLFSWIKGGVVAQ
jgi:DNA mismatch endonuclease, patch repair protein